MRTTIFLCMLTIFITACGGGQKQEQSTEQNNKTLTTPIEKQFYLGGLKYEITIQIFIGNDGSVNGTFSSSEYGDNPIFTSFAGTIVNDEIKVKFNGDPPIVGDKTEWLNKPWKIIKKDGKEILVITFNVINFETNEWEESEWEFENIP